MTIIVYDEPRRILYFTYLLSLLLIFTTSFISWNYYDVQWWLEWCFVAEKFGITKIYLLSPKLAYFPLFPLTFIFFYKIAQLLHIANNINLLRIVEKIPIAVAIVVGGEIIWRETGSLEATCLWLLGVPTLEIFWGYQYDVIVGVLLLLHVKYLRDKCPTLAGLCLGLATLYKQAVILAVTLGLKTIRDLKSLLKYLTTTLGTIFLVCLPFALPDPLAFLGKTLLFHSDRLPQEVSIWNIPQLALGHLIPTLRHLWLIPTLLLLLWVTLRLRVEDGDISELARFQVLTLGIVILLNKIGNPPYFLWIYPSIILWLAYMRAYRKSMLLPLLVLSLAGFVLHPLLVYLPRVILDKPLLIVEDTALWNTYWLYLHSYQGIALYFAEIVVKFFRSVPALRMFMFLLYKYFNVIDIALALMYNISLAYLLYAMARS